MSGEEEENAAELKIGEEFLKAKCLMNCEVAIILEHKYEQIQQHASESDPSSQVSQVFEKSLQYVKRFSGYKNPDAVRQVRETLSRYGLAEFELCPVSRLPCLRPEGILQKDETRQKLRHRPMDSAPHTEHFNTEAGKQKHQQHSIGCNPMP